MDEGIVFTGDEFVRPEEASFSIFDAGLVWGDAVYDVTSSWNNWIFRLDEHLERFQCSVEGFRLNNPYNHDEMRRICAECVSRSGLQNAYIKVQLTRGLIKNQTSQLSWQGDCKFITYAMPYVWIWGEKKSKDGGNLFVSNVERISSNAVDQRFKNYNRADLVQSRFEAYDNNCDDSLLCGPDGYLTEGPGYNVFLVKGGNIYTPSSNILEGITRLTVRELCDMEHIDLNETNIYPNELQEADEIFCSTSAGGILPVTQLNSIPIGNGHKGLITSRLQKLYWKKRDKGWHGTHIDDLI